MGSPEASGSMDFFLENAGYCTPPGQDACALRLARAEAWAEKQIDAGLARYVIAQDDIAPEDTYSDQQDIDAVRSGDVVLLFVAFQVKRASCPTCKRGDEWETVASLGGIGVPSCDGASDPYIRVVKADLAQEGRTHA